MSCHSRLVHLVVFLPLSSSSILPTSSSDRIAIVVFHPSLLCHDCSLTASSAIQHRQPVLITVSSTAHSLHNTPTHPHAHSHSHSHEGPHAMDGRRYSSGDEVNRGRCRCAGGPKPQARRTSSSGPRLTNHPPENWKVVPPRCGSCQQPWILTMEETMNLVFCMVRVPTKDLMKLSAGFSKAGPLNTCGIPQDSAQQDTTQVNTEHEQPRPLTDTKDHGTIISPHIPSPPPYRAAYKAEPCEAGPSNTSRIWPGSAQQVSARGDSGHEQPWPLTDTNQNDTISSPDISSPLPNDLSAAAGVIEEVFEGGFPPNNQSLADSLGGPSSIRCQNGSPCNLDDDVPRSMCILQDPDGWCRHPGLCKFNQTDEDSQPSRGKPPVASPEGTDESESASPASSGCCGPLCSFLGVLTRRCTCLKPLVRSENARGKRPSPSYAPVQKGEDDGHGGHRLSTKLRSLTKVRTFKSLKSLKSAVRRGACGKGSANSDDSTRPRSSSSEQDLLRSHDKTAPRDVNAGIAQHCQDDHARSQKKQQKKQGRSQDPPSGQQATQNPDPQAGSTSKSARLKHHFGRIGGCVKKGGNACCSHVVLKVQKWKGWVHDRKQWVHDHVTFISIPE